MPGTPTTKYALPTLGGSDLGNTIDAWSQSFAAAVDAIIATAVQGTLGARPAYGKVGRFYYAGDVGRLYWDTGSAWLLVFEYPEGWHVVGDVSEPIFKNGWTADPTSPPKFYRNAGRVHLQGAVLHAPAVASSVPFTLPSGYTPGVLLTFACVVFGGPGYCQIDTTGDLVSPGGAGTTRVVLDGISFRHT